MRYSEQPLQTFRLRNFKAVRDSGVVKFSPFTIFIGNNGSGKSSLIEGLETFQSIVTDGLDEAMNRWRGFENVLNKAVLHRPCYPLNQRPCLTNPMSFEIRGGFERDGNITSDAFSRYKMEINAAPDYNEIFIQREKARVRIQDDLAKVRDSYGRTEIIWSDEDKEALTAYPMGQSIIQHFSGDWVSDWQFLNLEPEKIGQPTPRKRTGRTIKLSKDGSNIGDLLTSILLVGDDGVKVLRDIIEALRYIVPYAQSIHAVMTSEIQHLIYLQLIEQNFKVPGWLLSTGTLRILALLAVLRHPEPPPLLFIEEIENGLDPRTLNLLVDEIQRATQSGKTQVVCTTHSPYFLDLVSLSSLIVVERDESGQPTFTRPDEKSLGEWATKFAPGQLYTMSQLTRS